MNIVVEKYLQVGKEKNGKGGAQASVWDKGERIRPLLFLHSAHTA